MRSRCDLAGCGRYWCCERNGRRYALRSRCDLAGCGRSWRCERNGRRYALRSRLIIAWFGRYLCCERDAGHCFLRSERDSVKDGGCRCGERQIAGWICLSCWCVALLLPQAASGAGAGVVLSRFAVYSRSGAARRGNGSEALVVFRRGASVVASAGGDGPQRQRK